MFNLTINTDGAAFIEEGEEVETARILRAITRLILEGSRAGRALDCNGNTVGEWSFSD